jgi:thiamine-monophosphate kinase
MKCTHTIASGIVEALAGGTSILDISDGLARDAHRISKASGVSSEINSRDLQGFEAALEQVAARPLVSPGDWVRFGGEDH